MIKQMKNRMCMYHFTNMHMENKRKKTKQSIQPQVSDLD